MHIVVYMNFPVVCIPVLICNQFTCIWIFRNLYPQINVQASVYDLASKDCI